MKTGAVIAIVAGVIIVLFWATSRGLIQTGVGGVAIGPSGRQTGIVAPQPSSNYSGYLAATTAPQVSGILNGLLSGISGSVSTWFGKPQQTTPVAQGTRSDSPALAASPSGPDASVVNQLASQGVYLGATPVGPQVAPEISYNSTSQSAFDVAGLAADNAWTPASTLDDVGQAVSV